jgi:hypothetical protein
VGDIWSQREKQVERRSLNAEVFKIGRQKVHPGIASQNGSKPGVQQPLSVYNTAHAGDTRNTWMISASPEIGIIHC